MKLDKPEFKLTVGLEIHAELKTEAKMFCNSKNQTGDVKPNTNVCPVCLGYPGTLPTINKEAVKSVLRLGKALGGELADYTEFDRKNYFYPDIPKGYQISQYKYPLVSGGSIGSVEITRIHLEEDTAKSTHPSTSLRTSGDGESLLDFNRAGVPLMELVTEPVMHTAEEAVSFAKELQLILHYLGISDANMEKGEMRVEANISVSKGKGLGTKVEVKNINSFRAVEKTIEYEYNRQSKLLEEGGEVVQETRGWNDVEEVTFSQRIKESAHDYRYFPDPDLPKIFISEIKDLDEGEIEKSLPELPQEKRKRYKKEYGLKSEDIEIYVRQSVWGDLFEEAARMLKEDGLEASVSKLSNYITVDLKKVVPAEPIVEVIKMIESGELSSRAAKDILKVIEEKPLDYSRGKEVREIVKEKDLIQESDRKVLEKVVEEVLEENDTDQVQFLVGQAMKKTNGKANPVILQELISKILDK